MTTQAPASPLISVTKTQLLSDTLLKHIENVLWGFKDGVCYRIMERRAEIERALKHGSFLILQRDETLLGTLLCIHKQVSLGGSRSARALYETALSVVAGAHGQGHAKYLLQESASRVQGRCMEYAYIENLNIPSAAAFQSQGYRPIGEFDAVTINRLWPTRSSRVQRLAPNRVEEMKSLLKSCYWDHALTDFDASFCPENYWILQSGGRMVAGVQLEDEAWSIVSMPGLEGRFATEILPRLPIARHLLNPSYIRILKIGSLFVQPGFEKEWMELVNHLSHLFKRNLALAYLDKKSPVAERLRSKLSFGLFNLFFETPVTIWAKFYDFQEEEIQAIARRPFFISPLDLS